MVRVLHSGRLHLLETGEHGSDTDLVRYRRIIASDAGSIRTVGGPKLRSTVVVLGP